MLILIRFALSVCSFLSRFWAKRKGKEGERNSNNHSDFFSSPTCTTYTTRKEMASFLEVNFALCTRQLLIAELL